MLLVIFLKHYLEHCRVNKKKTPRIQYQTLLVKINASFEKNTKFALTAVGFEQFYEFQNMKHPCTFQDIKRTIWHFGQGFSRPVSNSRDQIWPGRGHLTLTLGRKGTQGILREILQPEPEPLFHVNHVMFPDYFCCIFNVTWYFSFQTSLYKNHVTIGFRIPASRISLMVRFFWDWVYY